MSALFPGSGPIPDLSTTLVKLELKPNLFGRKLYRKRLADEYGVHDVKIDGYYVSASCSAEVLIEAWNALCAGSKRPLPLPVAA